MIGKNWKDSGWGLLARQVMDGDAILIFDARVGALVDDLEYGTF